MKGINHGKSQRKMRCFGVQCVGRSSRMEIVRRDAHTFPVQKALLSVGFLLSAPVVGLSVAG